MWHHLLDLLAAVRRPLVVLDFETSGLGGAPPVEFAVLVWAPWEPPQKDVLTATSRARTPPGLTYAATMRLDPLRPIDPGAMRVHGIRDADVRGVATRWDDMEVRAFFRGYADGDPADAGGPIGPAVWCGHNAAASDVPWARLWGYLPGAEVDLIDTIRCARRLAAEHPHPLVVDEIPGVGEDSAFVRTWGHPLVPAIEDGLDCYASSLVGVHKALVGQRPAGSHGALADCEATARVLARVLDLWAPLYAVAGADRQPPAQQLAALLAALDAPPPREVAWDGWLTVDEQGSAQGAMRYESRAPRHVWRRGKFRGAPAHRDEWVLSLPRSPTGDDARPAWCSPRTAAILEGLR